MSLVLKVPGATAEELARGVAAAQAVLDAAGVTLQQAARAQFDREGWDVEHGFADDKQPPEPVMAAASALDAARWAAMEACCAGWAERPADWQLEGGGQDTGG